MSAGKQPAAGYRCNKCHRPMPGTGAYDGACGCGGLIEAVPAPKSPAPELHKLALACWDGACNVRGIVRELAGVINEIPAGQCRDSVDLKIIVGQLSFLVGETLGPSERAIADFRKAVDG